MLIPVLVGCGDYCLFCDGQGSGGGGGGEERTAIAGDVILADQSANSIFIYEYEDEKQRSLVSGYWDVSGLALYSSGAEDTCDNPFAGLAAYQNGGNNIDEIDILDQDDGQPDRLSLAVIPKGTTFPYGADQTDPDETTIDLLFFTVNTENRLYIYDLTGATVPDEFSNPYPLTNSDLGTGFLASPTALAIDVDGDTATLFVLNEEVGDSSVKRLSVDLETWVPDPDSTHTLATMSQDNFRLVDLALSRQTDTKALFISKKLINGVGGWVYRISDPSTSTATLDLNTATSLVQREQRVTGLTAPSTNEEDTSADLVLLKENIAEFQVEQYDPAVGGQTPDAAYTPSLDFDFLQAIEYDCTNERLLMTNVPFNNDFDRTFFEATPTQ